MVTPEPRSRRWRKSTFSGASGDSGCVEIALTPDAVAVRDSKHAGGEALDLTTDAWHALLLTLTQ